MSKYRINSTYSQTRFAINIFTVNQIIESHFMPCPLKSVSDLHIFVWLEHP